MDQVRLRPRAAKLNGYDETSSEHGQISGERKRLI